MITHVAIKDRSGKVWAMPKPYRHGDVMLLVYRTADRPDLLLESHLQGFLDQNDKFLTRLDAWHEAFRCGQLLPPYNPINPAERAWNLLPSTKPAQLFSEDIW